MSEVHLGVLEVHLGVSEVHLGVSEVHLGVSIGVILACFSGFWVLRRKLSSLLSKFSGFLKNRKNRRIFSFPKNKQNKEENEIFKRI